MSPKTFSIQETMLNAQSARKWILKNGGDEQDIALNFVAVSTNQPKLEAFGICPDNIFYYEIGSAGFICYGQQLVYPLL